MENSPPVQHLLAVVRAAVDAAQRQGGEVILDDIEETMATLTPEALGLVPYAHAYISPPTTLPGYVRYLHLAQEATHSVGIFVLAPHGKIPCHDHPSMHVVSHVLYGAVKITSYDRVAQGASAAAPGGSRSSNRSASGCGAASRMSWLDGGGFGGGGGSGPPQLATLRGSAWHSAPHTSRLTPSVANVHELEAGRDGTAILDVLIPPYDEGSGRECTYYRPEYEGSAATGGGGGGRVRLVPCTPGNEFRVVRGEFISPFPS